MGQFFKDLVKNIHFVWPNEVIRRPLIITFCILIALGFLLCCAPRLCCSSSNREANEAVAAHQNGEAGGIQLQNAAEFHHNNANTDPVNSRDAPTINPHGFIEINPGPLSYSNSIMIDDCDEDTSNSDYATIRPRLESSCRLPKFNGPPRGSSESSISGPLNVSTIREDKKARNANQQSVAAPSNVRQSAFGLFVGDELNAEELNFDLFRRRSSTVINGNSSICGESNVNVASVSVSAEPIIPPVDYDEPSIPPVDYNEELSIPPADYSSEYTINYEELSRSDYIVDGASQASDDLDLHATDNEDRLDDLIEEAISSLDDVLEAACLPTSAIQDPEDNEMNNSFSGVKIIKMVPKK